MRVISAISALLVAAGASAHVLPRDDNNMPLGSPTAMGGNVPSGQISVNLVTLNGSGCPPGSAEVAVSPDNSAFTVTYSDYIVQNGPGTKITDFRKNCQALVQVHVPSGFTYAIAQATYRGFAQLQPGVTLNEKASFFFQGDSLTGTLEHNFNNIDGGDWQATDQAEVASLIFAPCGATRYLAINTALFLMGNPQNGQQSMASMDSLDASVSTKYNFAWKRC